MQSGSDRILKEMGRNHTAEDFRKAILMLRKEVSDITIETDIICGFPGETDSDFKSTRDLIRELRPELINVSRYSARPGTKAAGMRQTPSVVITGRTKVMAADAKMICAAQSRRWIGWKGEVIIERTGDRGSIGRNPSYAQVIVPGRHMPGKRMNVEIVSSGTHHLLAAKPARHCRKGSSS